MAGSPPTAADPAALLVRVITGVEGGTDEHWAQLIGEIEQLPIIGNVRSNRAVRPRARGTRRTSSRTRPTS